MPTLEKIVVRLKPHHPSGQRKRAGFRFDETAQMVEVTPEQKEQIENDSYLIVITKGTAFLEAEKVFNSKFTDSAPESGDDDDDENDDDSGNDGDNDDDSDDGDEDGEQGDDEPKGKPVERMTKKELIEALVEKGLEAEKDFNPEATNKALQELLKA